MTVRAAFQNVSFSHDRKTNLALNHVNLDIEDHKIYGLWGRNGAGKTTLLHCLFGLIQPSEGSVSVSGSSPMNHKQLTEDICFIQENHPLHPLWKIKDVFVISRHFYPNWDEEKAVQLLERFSLDSKMKIKQLSKGMKTAVSIVIGMASKSRVTVFDEPSNGLDAASREAFYALLIEEYEQSQRTFILSSHYIQEIQGIVEELIVMKQGEIVLKEPIDQLLERSVYIMGQSAIIHEHFHQVPVLEKKDIQDMRRIMVETSRLNPPGAAAVDVQYDQVPLQQFLLRKTEPEEGRE
ncbi:ATP-binding cassette domain-containing protein [Halobacillus amylolyticus]|uniref:ABC transporter ATP-binding protein n=1 Tax=Halobacillus amylolyticus TaxID=2932259 RepID=A0ABY4HD76_9BACI|nr:ABC transporter ATP-binding protein [Halobacillus amylolyticus]UOR11850.1 ABC transporter ATP-binding protein [Halobacillus amylolyticus]